MRADLRNAVRREAGTGAAARALPLAVGLTVLVVAAAGLAGTAHFTGARWYPHIGTGSGPSHRPPHFQTVTQGSRRPPVAKRGSGSVPDLVIVPGALIVIFAAYLLWRWLRGRWRAAPSALSSRQAAARVMQVPAPEPEPEPARLLTGIELALQALDEEREPADAVVRAWLGLQQTAEQSGIVRGASETPTEFAARVLTRAFADAQPLHTLLRLYLRTRFGDHPVTANDVSAVRDALQRLLASSKATEGAAETAVR
ncbi:MAG: DUF4129 domain-containing protein [Acidobacteriota bacterium]|nr:DUF4129 domain-containing protein [Acidobacteriota bacterium]